MKIVNEFPPAFDKINNIFSLNKDVIYTFGDTIYNPGNCNITPDVEAHEEVHQKQQGDNPTLWWNRYLEDPLFRLNQELEAYQRQYEFFCSVHKDKNRRFKFLHQLATVCSSGIYGNMIRPNEAMRRIKGQQKG